MHIFLKFIFRRIVLGAITIFLISTLTFVLMKSAPGDPFLEEQNMPPEAYLALRKHYGFDDPLPVQYMRYIKSAFSFDLGNSLKYPAQTVNEIITSGFAKSMTIGLEALLIAIPMGIIIGIIGALCNRGLKNFVAIFITILGVSVPSFVIASTLQFLFAIWLPIFPVARWGSFSHSVLPALALACGPTCFIARLLRTSMLEVLSEKYIHTARTKGINCKRILFIHALKNACLPVLSYIGPVTTNVLVGSFVVERVFGIPGLGGWFVTSVINRDYSVIGGLTLFYSIILLGIHTFIDIIIALLDPRISLAKQEEFI
jgi:oligopeptide transport system permease protein